MTLFHGSTNKVSDPIISFGRANLDFGQGFYLTDLKEQAISWAKRQSDARKTPPVLNIYDFEKERAVTEFRYLHFKAYDKDWLHFIVDSRNGLEPWKDYDIIEGGVADDRVIDSVNLYSIGLMSEETALHNLSLHQPNNQICILNQTVVEKYLKFIECIKV